MDARQARLRHESRLLKLANVTGVGTGRNERTGEDLIVVFVSRKVPRAELRAEEVVPAELDGVPVQVLAVGDVSAQSS